MVDHGIGRFQLREPRDVPRLCARRRGAPAYPDHSLQSTSAHARRLPSPDTGTSSRPARASVHGRSVCTENRLHRRYARRATRRAPETDSRPVTCVSPRTYHSAQRQKSRSPGHAARCTQAVMARDREIGRTPRGIAMAYGALLDGPRESGEVGREMRRLRPHPRRIATRRRSLSHARADSKPERP